VTPVLLLHGYTMNGASFASDTAPLFTGGALLPVPLDGPFPCGSDATLLDRRPPHHTWWRATDDGSVYAGWEAARDVVGRALAAHPGAAVLGFSQGAMLAALVAAWSARGELPPVSRVVLVAGRRPRAVDLQAALATPVAVPSLHVTGERDPMAPLSPELEACFVAPETLRWPGPHVVPTRGPASERIRSFLVGPAR
jgi:predicted esterase